MRAVLPAEISPETYEAKARELAQRFGVDPSLEPRKRAAAIAKAMAQAGGVGGGYRRRRIERVPGEDDE